MSFYDIRHNRFSTFDQVKEIVAKVKPYRGTENKYPLGARRYSDRSFTFHGDHIVAYYGQSELFKFHEDNSVEFLHDNYYVGSSMLMTSFFTSKFVVKSEIRMGGDIIVNDNAMHPVFKGLRVFINTPNLDIHPSVKYNYRYKVLDREKTRSIRKLWEEKLKLTKAFFLASDTEQMIQESNTVEARQSLIGETTLESDTYLQFLYLARDGGFMRKSNRSGGWYSGVCVDTHREEVFKKVREKFFDRLYSYNEDVFEWKEVEMGKRPPSGNWGVEVTYHINQNEEAV